VQELYLAEEQPGAELPYELLLADAMAGDGALFTREDAVEAAWSAVEPVLEAHHRDPHVQARHLGPARGGRAHCGRRPLAQPTTQESVRMRRSGPATSLDAAPAWWQRANRGGPADASPRSLSQVLGGRARVAGAPTVTHARRLPAPAGWCGE
jgi:hypothetical protein